MGLSDKLNEVVENTVKITEVKPETQTEIEALKEIKKAQSNK